MKISAFLLITFIFSSVAASSYEGKACSKHSTKKDKVSNNSNSKKKRGVANHERDLNVGPNHLERMDLRERNPSDHVRER